MCSFLLSRAPRRQPGRPPDRTLANPAPSFPRSPAAAVSVELSAPADRVSSFGFVRGPGRLRLELIANLSFVNAMALRAGKDLRLASVPPVEDGEGQFPAPGAVHRVDEVLVVAAALLAVVRKARLLLRQEP